MLFGRRALKVIPGGRATSVRAPSPLGADSADAGEGPWGLPDLYRRYGASVYGRCHYLLKDAAQAEDAMQDVFAKALINAAGFRAEASPLNWLTKIATNHCLNLLRSARAPWHKTFEHHELTRADHEQRTGGMAGPRLFENREAVRRLLAGVDLETQAAAIHYYVDEMTLEEVAAALGRSVPTVRKRLDAFAAQGGAQQGSSADD